MLAPLLRRRSRPLPRPLAEGIAVTVAATVATAPLMAHHFGTVSVAGLPANVLALPLVAPIMWLGMVRGRACPARPGGAAAGRPGRPAARPRCCRALASLATAFAGMPGGQLGVPLRGAGRGRARLRRTGRRGRRRWPGSPAASTPRPRPRAGAAPGRGARHRRGGRRRGGGRARCSSAWPRPPSPPARLTVSFLDVGQGDATLVQAPGGVAILFDGGPPGGRRRPAAARGRRPRPVAGGRHPPVARPPRRPAAGGRAPPRSARCSRTATAPATPPSAGWSRRPGRGAPRAQRRGRGRRWRSGRWTSGSSARRRATRARAGGSEPARAGGRGRLPRVRPVPLRRRRVRARWRTTTCRRGGHEGLPPRQRRPRAGRPSSSGCGRGWPRSRWGRQHLRPSRALHARARSARPGRASTAPTATAPSASAVGDGGAATWRRSGEPPPRSGRDRLRLAAPGGLGVLAAVARGDQHGGQQGAQDARTRRTSGTRPGSPRSARPCGSRSPPSKALVVVGGGHRGGDRQAQGAADLLRGVDQPRRQPGLGRLGAR